MATPLCFGYEGFDCSISWLVMVGLFFLAAILKKQLADFSDFEFSMLGGTIAGLLIYIIVTIITHSMKWSFAAGLIGVLVAGFLAGPFLEGGGSESGFD